MTTTLYEYVGSGAKYEFLGLAKGAGTSKTMKNLVIYKSVDDGQLYFREPPDFFDRMKVFVDYKANAIESLAEFIYNQWSNDPEFVLWKKNGNSVKQHKARDMARKVIEGQVIA